MRRVLLAALLVVLAGCGGALPGTGDGTPTATPTAAPVPGDETSSLPPGLREGVNATVLAAATAESLSGAAYTWRFQHLEARPEFSLGTVYVGPRITANVSGPGRYVLTRQLVNARGGGLSVETFRNATYVRRGFVRLHDGNRTVTRRAGSRDAGRPSRLAAAHVRTHLAVENASLRLLANGSALVEGTGTRRVNGTDYSVTALVAPDGSVRRFTAIYTRDDRVQFVEFRLERGTAFAPPEWATENATVTATAG